MSRKSRAKDAQTPKKQGMSRSTMLIIVIVAAIAILAAGVVIFNGWNRGNDSGDTPVTPVATHHVIIEVQDYGKIIVELYGNVAPITVDNFVKLVNEGFYDGLTFHRVISGFMIQGGDPNGNGTGGSSTRIKGEFSANGVNNPILHKRGVLSMARSSAPDSASSQFFIMHQDAPHLDGAYAAFGMVTSGMEVVDAICANTPVIDGNGTVTAPNQPVITRMYETVEPVSGL